MNPVSDNLPQHLQFAENQSEVVIQKVEDKSMKCVVFVGDVITLEEKQSPLRRLGGKLFPDKKCVPNNIITQCAITPLEPGMMSVLSSLVNPDERKNYLSSYTKTNVWNPMTLRRESIEIGRSGMSEGLLFKQIYPSQEIGQIAYKRDGVVEVPGISDVREIIEAQMFYFPNWARIAAGHAVLPNNLRVLKDQIQEKMEQTRHQSLLAVGEAFLRSCDEFRLWGKAYVDQQTAAIKDAEKKPGVSQRYDEIAERLFDALEITREDGLIKNFALGMNQQAEQNNQMQTVLTLAMQILANQQGIAVGAASPLTPAIKPFVPPAATDASAQISEDLLNSLQTSEITGGQPADGDGNNDSGTGDGNADANNEGVSDGDGATAQPNGKRKKPVADNA